MNNVRKGFFLGMIAGLVIGSGGTWLIGRMISSPISRLPISAFRESENLFHENAHDADIRLIIRTDKNCYYPNDTIPMWVELFNSSQNSLMVLKSMRIFTGGNFLGLTPFVNGHEDKAMVLVIDNIFPQEDEYATLSPNESAITYFPNFLDLTFSFRSLSKMPASNMMLEVEYRNLVPGIPKEMRIPSDGNDPELLFEPKEVWTGILRSNQLMVHITNDLETCVA